jgi:hypothetical protein
MSWEAFRLTSKSPAELMHTLGPHGVDHLIRQALDTLWREYPDDKRTFENVLKRSRELFDRNMKVWSAIKKPTPAEFFENLLPYPADGFLRQAMVLCWMMIPRTGGRDLKTVRKIITEIFERNIDGWKTDHKRFTDGKSKRIPPPKKKPVKTNKTAKKVVKKSVKRKK